MSGPGWRLCLFALLLSAGRADVSKDLKGATGGHMRDTRSGYYDSNESKAEEDSDFLISVDKLTYKDDDFGNKNKLHSQFAQDKKGLYAPGRGNAWLTKEAGPYLPGHLVNQAPNDLLLNGVEYPNTHVSGDPGHLKYSSSDLLPAKLIKDAYHHDARDANNDYPLTQEGNVEVNTTSIGFMSRLIPNEEHVELNQIPGAQRLITCSVLGELHNLWGPQLQCMVCVCLRAQGKLRPLCVSCDGCRAEPAPTTTEPPAPPVTPPEKVSCDPLPVNVPFQSPLDPCKICVCTENYSPWGKKDVQIHCQHNPHCVLPTTESPGVSTPIPLPVCDKLPQNVPFPHPHDPCKLCTCAVRYTIYGTQEQYITCFPNPECKPDTETPEPVTDVTLSPVTDLPPPEICDLHPVDIPFLHPTDPCQLCRCIDTGIFQNKIITCIPIKDCLPTPEPSPITTPEPEIDCKVYPVDVVFPHPADPCRLCRCTLDFSSFIPVKKLDCFVAPNCITTTAPTSTTGPVTEIPPDNVKCAPLPTGTPFQNPLNPCQICVCTERVDLFGKIDVQITCQKNPKCVVPDDVTTLPPEISTLVPLPACKHFPENVWFPHPSDACQLCKCTPRPGPHGTDVGHITCRTTPECQPVTTEEPVPENICDNKPLDVLFPHPSDPCKACKCYKNLNENMVQIACYIKPECVPTEIPETTTEAVEPDLVHYCEHFPENVNFPHPADACRLCRCYRDSLNPFQMQIICFQNPDCSTPKPPSPTTTPRPVPEPVSCAPLPTGTPFQNPLNPCQICVCTEHVDLFGRIDVQITCQKDPKCVLPPDVTTLPPVTDKPEPLPACKQLPPNVVFTHPHDSCLECKCIVQNNMFGVPEEYITCNLKEECAPTEEPVTEKPDPYEFCKHHKLEEWFNLPIDPCTECMCYRGPPPDASPNAPIAPTLLYKCRFRPECRRPTTESHVTVTPTPPAVSCAPLPSDRPFQNPLNPCQECICVETTDAAGRPDVQISCRDNSHCVLPDDVTTVPPTPDTSPIPLPACAHFPPNVLFPHPTDPCQTCKCTVNSTAWGTPEQHITCYTKPHCEPEPPGPSTILPPEPSICDNYPLNILFPLPDDPCKLCRCSSTLTIYGEAKEITCIANPACSEIPTTTPAEITTPPWPPAPPGPLPGPGPHQNFTEWPDDESCSPYKPDLPFQHPWDECQVCICREAISTDRITIEVNCYTKQSCCIEIPFDVPDIPGSENVIGPLSGNAIRPTGGKGILPTGGNVIEHRTDQWRGSPRADIIEPTGGNKIGPTGGNVINTADNVIGPKDQLHKLTGEQLYKLPGENVIEPTGGNKVGPTVRNVISSAGNLIGPSDKLYRPEDLQWYGTPNKNIIEPTGGNKVGPISGNVIDMGENLPKPNDNIIGPSGGHEIENTGGNIIPTLMHPSVQYPGRPSINVIGPTGGNITGPTGSNVRATSRGNSIKPLNKHFRPIGEKRFGPPTINYIRPLNAELISHPGDDWSEELDQFSLASPDWFVIPSDTDSIGYTGNNMGSHTGHNHIGLTGANVPYNRPRNQYASKQSNFLNRGPIGSYVRPGHSRNDQQVGFPGIINGLPIWDYDGLHGNISPDLEFREGGINAQFLSELTGFQNANAHAKASAFAHGYRGSTKMRTKSGKPKSDSESGSGSEDYD